MNVGTCCAIWLGRYEQTFRENDIDAEVLAELTPDDLSGLGITSVGHRRKLLAAIAPCAGSAPAASPPPEALTTVPKTALPHSEAEPAAHGDVRRSRRLDGACRAPGPRGHARCDRDLSPLRGGDC